MVRPFIASVNSSTVDHRLWSRRVARRLRTIARLFEAREARESRECNLTS